MAAKVNHVVNGSTGFANDAAANAYIAANGWVPEVGWEYLDTTLSVVKIWDGGAWVTLGGAGGGNPSLPGILNYLVVDLGTNIIQNSTQQFPFHTIQGALAVANYDDVVLVYPGIFTEQITPVDGVTLRGIDQDRCILQNVGASTADCPIGTAFAVSMRIENLTVRATQVDGLVVQLIADQDFIARDTIVRGQIDVSASGARALLEHKVDMVGQIILGTNANLLEIYDSEVRGGNVTTVPILVQDINTTIRVRRSELRGAAGSEAIQWQAQNNNVELEWAKVWHGDGVSNPFGRTGAETPTYSGHHNDYSLNPEQGAIWSNSIPLGQRFDTPDEQSFAAANNQAAPANVVGLAFGAATRSAKVQLSVYVDATADLCEIFDLLVVRRGTNWFLTAVSTGDLSGLAFTILNTGQVQYTSTNAAGWVSTDVRFSAKVTGV